MVTAIGRALITVLAIKPDAASGALGFHASFQTGFIFDVEWVQLHVLDANLPALDIGYVHSIPWAQSLQVCNWSNPIASIASKYVFA